ncbi:MAG TPA: hypothetical protein PLB05_04370 [Candidatus Omnitrophota bacterium]|nr:hypothetical protein [Candidatus Omnitrophota bacterium]
MMFPRWRFLPKPLPSDDVYVIGAAVPSLLYGIFFLLLAGTAVSLSSCASVMTVQPQVGRLAASGRYAQALTALETRQALYGKNNQLLFLLEKGMILHLNGQYRESIAVFENAKSLWEDLYTESLTKIAASWVANDYALPYRGEDFERVMVNIFQALNFAALEDYESALVEARDVDSKLAVINEQYPPGQKNVYREDAFARLLAGILYESAGSYGNLNDALISYEKAYDAYANDYREHYGLEPPRVLLENLCTLARWTGGPDEGQYQGALSGQDCPSLKEKSLKAEVIIIQYHGSVPDKRTESVLIPLPGGYVSSFSFPQYSARSHEDGLRVISVRDQQGKVRHAETEAGEEISRIASKNLADRKTRIMIKGAARSAGRYFIERHIENEIAEKHGRDRARWFPVLASFLNLAVDRADLRSWQTLPAEIRIARFILDPGHYTFFLGQDVLLGDVAVSPGQKRFILFCSNF